MAENETAYPRWLIRLFAAGFIIVLFAAIVWPFNSLLGSILAALGTLAAVWPLLKGEAISDEQ